jgi:DNA-binding LacI/PurR family transcriptional regulator
LSKSPLSPLELRVVTHDDPARAASISRATESRKAGGSPKASNAVGVVAADPTTGLFSDAYYSSVLKGISTALAERSLLLMLLAPQSTPELEATQSLLVGKLVDGVIMVGLHVDSPLPTLMRKRGIPAVLCGRWRMEFEISCIDCDNREGATLAVNHLLSLGRRRIAVISGNLDVPSAVDRLMGYRDALASAGIPIDPTVEEVADYYPERARMAMQRLLLNHPDLDAVFVASDQMAVAAMGVLAQAGKRIPQDVAVIGFDDSRYARESSPALSSIRQPIEETGREAVHVLMRHMAEPQETPRQVILKTKLVVRESTVGTDGLVAAGRL